MLFYLTIIIYLSTCAINSFLVCSEAGQFLAHPTNRCLYLECVYDSDPWPVNGVVPLITLVRSCAPGVGTPLGYVGGFDNPCTVGLSICKGKSISEVF